MRLFFLILPLLFSLNLLEHVAAQTVQAHQDSWLKIIQEKFFTPHGVGKYFENPELLKPWRKSTETVIDRHLLPNQIRVKNLNCRVKRLWPTHPSQATKEYVIAVTTDYHHHRLPVNSPACLRPNPTKKFCVQGALPNMAILSDIFEDECGNFYRGYWLVTYFRSDESMGTLFSKGRSAAPKPDCDFANGVIEVEEQGTYGVEASQFFMLGELLPGDANKMRVEKLRASSQGFRLRGKQFVK